MVHNPAPQQSFGNMVKAWIGDRSLRDATVELRTNGLQANHCGLWKIIKGLTFPPSTKVSRWAKLLGVDQQDLAMVIALDRGRKVAARLSGNTAEQVVESHVVAPGMDCGRGDAPSAAHDASVSNQASEVA
jgi:hypothetical protein